MAEMKLESLVMIAVSLLIIAIVFPIALGALNDINTTALSNLDPSLVTLLQVLVPMLAIVGVAVSFIYYVRS